MRLRSNSLLAVLTVAALTLASGTIQAYVSLCQQAEIPVQESCCPNQDQSIQAEDCPMGGCDCTIGNLPVQQDDSPALVPSNGPTWAVPAIADSRQLPQFESAPPRSEVIRTNCVRGPPQQLDASCNGLRAPPNPSA